jgi:hypothetical protein
MRINLAPPMAVFTRLAANNIQGMGQNRQYYIQAFTHTPGAARQIDNQASTPYASYSTAEYSFSLFLHSLHSHGLN